eukprot:TRINITY_DN1489_c0_g1_i1.p2 TRINITY_DN1489_c0_g1~~TRINITY_DN1489_c0_g1_i1.p2  ORF type:complete len:178 (+),score=6.71 TRINITY_DN1489_c0_g1_i1:655-1188(+)
MDSSSAQGGDRIVGMACRFPGGADCPRRCGRRTRWDARRRPRKVPRCVAAQRAPLRRRLLRWTRSSACCSRSATRRCTGQSFAADRIGARAGVYVGCCNAAPPRLFTATGANSETIDGVLVLARGAARGSARPAVRRRHPAPGAFEASCAMRMLAPDGRCAWDAAADGYCAARAAVR